jgi:hypothetical protein
MFASFETTPLLRVFDYDGGKIRGKVVACRGKMF